MQTLIVIDPQRVYFTDELLPVVNPYSLTNIQQLIEHFQGPKILIRHEAEGTPFAADHPGAKFVQGIDADAFDIIIPKHYASAFCKTDLHEYLDRMVVDGSEDQNDLVICGYQSHHCVLATVFDAASRGGYVYVVTDACSSPNLVEVCAKWERNPAEPACGLIGGHHVHAVGMAAACQFYATPIKTAEVIGRFS
jgi:nicotinamidase-related amidase